MEGRKVTLQVTIELSDSLLETESRIQDGSEGSTKVSGYLNQLISYLVEFTASLSHSLFVVILYNCYLLTIPLTLRGAANF
jgi:hypothetical protein